MVFAVSVRIQATHLLFAAVAAGFVGAAGGLFARSVPQAGPLPVAEAPTVPTVPVVPAAPSGTALAAPAGRTLIGKVLEVLEVTSYTYVRIGDPAEDGQAGTWAAVPTAKLTVGAPIRVRAELEMRDFASTSLKRRFDSIWFGVIDDGTAPPVVENAPPGASKPTAPSVPVANVARAEGDLGRTVADVHAQRTALAGRKVRVRAVVVKLTEGVLGKNYLHVRDGSGDAQSGTDDLSVTTLATPKVGDTILLEGVVKLDVDVGSGYAFPTLVEDAVLVR